MTFDEWWDTIGHGKSYQSEMIDCARIAWEASRNEALEEAAKVADPVGFVLAYVIRSLKSPQGERR